jgi:hypothetical protein
MSYRFGNKIVNDGIVFYLDATNSLSHIFGSSIWKSIGKDNSIGTLENTVSDIVKSRKAIVFSEINSISYGPLGIEKLLDINTTGTITVQAFFYIDELQSKKNIFTAGWDGSSAVQYGVGISNSGSDTNIYAYIFNHSTVESKDAGTRIDTDSYPYRLLTVSFGNSKNVYFDETYLGTHSLTHTTLSGTNWVMGLNPLESIYFNGAVNAVVVYNRALSAAEISKNYNFFIQRP